MALFCSQNGPEMAYQIALRPCAIAHDIRELCYSLGAIVPIALRVVCFWYVLVCFGILGFVLSATVSIAYSKIRGQTGLGWGDVKLIAAVGALIGWQFVPWFIFLASISALIHVILQIIIRGKQAGRERIPFGPFLCGSSWLVWLYSIF